MHLNIREVRLEGSSQRGLAWLVLGLVAQLTACSSTSSSDAGSDAPKSADSLPASADSLLAKDGATADRTVPDATSIDVPLSPDSASPIPDAPLARGDGASDAQAMPDAFGGSSDLVQERTEPDGKTLQDTATDRDSSLSEDVRQGDAQRTPDATDARSDTLSIVPLSDPGQPVYYPDRAGTGACAGKTVGSVIEEIHLSNPRVPGGDLLMQNPYNDASFTWAFARSDGGFAFVFMSGEGDCAAGCISHTYWYFQTDANCVAWQVGMYDTGRYCGTALWGVPRDSKTMPSETCR